MLGIRCSKSFPLLVMVIPLLVHFPTASDEFLPPDYFPLPVMKILLLEYFATVSVKEFTLLVYFATASEDMFPLLSERDAPAEEFALLMKSRVNYGQRHINNSQDIQPFENNKWYQSLLRSFDHKKNNTQTSSFSSKSQSIQKMVKSSLSSKNEVFDYSFCSTSCLSQVEARLVEFKNQEIKFCEKIRGLEFNVECKNNRIERLTNELEELKKENEGLESKLTGFESAAKDLDTLLKSQRSDKNKEGLGY
uniref:Uncharacterized protein n=1 Tax=Tanacetum cinerariifolium TaxID=118510 RepID=A0A6L2NXV1_TANCI|nr:hypothetical protein [Tanacetum cinerariifolium]